MTASRQRLGPASASASPLELGADSCASGAELCWRQLSTTALIQNNVFHEAGETAVCFTSFRCFLWNTVPKDSAGPELAGFKSR